MADLAFLTDITEHLNILNLTLQGKDNLIYNMSDEIKGFQMKLELWYEQITENNLHFFPRLRKISENQIVDFTKYNREIHNLLTQFKERFVVLDYLQTQFDIFLAPFRANIRSAPIDLQMELIELQCSSKLKLEFLEISDTIAFYKCLDSSKYPALRNFAAKIVSMFGSTYICEQFFSKMNVNKCNVRNRVPDFTLCSIMRIATANSIQPNIDAIVTIESEPVENLTLVE